MRLEGARRYTGVYRSPVYRQYTGVRYTGVREAKGQNRYAKGKDKPLCTVRKTGTVRRYAENAKGGMHSMHKAPLSSRAKALDHQSTGVS